MQRQVHPCTQVACATSLDKEGDRARTVPGAVMGSVKVELPAPGTWSATPGPGVPSTSTCTVPVGEAPLAAVTVPVSTTGAPAAAGSGLAARLVKTVPGRLTGRVTNAVGEGKKGDPGAGMKVAVMTSMWGEVGAVVLTLYAPVALTGTDGSVTPLLVTCNAWKRSSTQPYTVSPAPTTHRN